MTLDYSILVCTYNPDERLLLRCLNAIRNLDRKDLFVEIFLIDNNSDTTINNLPFVSEFLSSVTFTKLLIVKEQGLTHARTAGIAAAKGRTIIFLDDDNEPDYNYLQELKKLETEHPNVAAWGPGNIDVEFIDGIDTKIELYAKTAFQQRKDKHITFANIRSWQNCYPYGTGLCIKADLLKSYHKEIKTGRFSMVDRKGNLLSSGGDVQMVLYCIEMGFAAGISPGLKVVHIIPGKRANYDYIKRLIYGACIGGSLCMLEVFPEHKDVLLREVLPGSKFLRRVIKRYFKLGLRKDPNKMFDLVRYISSACGIYLALNKPVPAGIAQIIKKLKLE